jgi:DNA-binding Lrp family transcriptional regulator
MLFVMMSDMFDGLDRLIAQALQVNARAPFSSIAAVLGVSDQTVARRYAQMRAVGACKVVGLIDPYADGGVPWLVRLRCSPGAAVPLAEALARREDTAWVRVTSGGTEIVCEAKSRAGDAALLQQLPRTPRIEQISAHCLLHMYFGGPASPIAKLGELSPKQLRALRPVTPQARSSRVKDTDAPLLTALARDGRTELTTLAKQTGWPAAAVRRRIFELLAGAALYFDIEFDARLFPMFAAQTLLWLSVEPSALDAAGDILSKDPQIAFAAATTGPTNLHATVSCADMQSTYRYLTKRVASVPGINSIETAPILRQVKRAA